MATPTRFVSTIGRTAISEASTLYQQGHIDAAIRRIEEALQREPESVELNYTYGTLISAGGDVLDAQPILERNLERAPDHLPTLKVLSNVYSDLRLHDQSVELVDRYLAIDPMDVEMLILAGGQRSVLGETEAALPYLQRATELGANPAAWSELGIAYRRLDRPDDAVAAFQQALAMDATHAAAMLNLGQLLIEMGQVEEGQALLDQHAELAVEADERDWAEGISALVGETDSHLRMAANRLQRNDVMGAMESYEAALQANPGSETAFLGLMDLNARSGRIGDALDWAERAAEQLPDNPNVHLYRATTLVQAGRIEEAEAAAARSRELGEWTAAEWSRMASAYFQTSRVAEAKEMYRRAHEADPDNPVPLLALAETEYFAGDTQRMLELLDQAAERTDENGDIGLMRALAHHRLGNPEAVDEGLRYAVERYRNAGIDPLEAASRFLNWPQAQEVFNRLPIILDR